MANPQGIVTPEAVVLDFERAGVASRALAMTLDVLALLATWVILLVTVGQLFGAAAELVGAVLAVFFSLALYFGWFVGFETVMQRTPGKAAFGLRVVAIDGTPVRFQQAFLRGVLGIVDFFLVPIGFVAVVTSLLTPRDQRLGDLAAGTLVVRQRTAGRPVTSARFPAPPGHADYAASLDAKAMDARHYELVRNFLLRAHTLAPGARARLAVTLANPVAGVLRHTPPPGLHPELFLVCVAAAWQHAHGADLTAAPPPGPTAHPPGPDFTLPPVRSGDPAPAPPVRPRPGPPPIGG